MATSTLRLVPHYALIVLAFLLLGAHFLRDGAMLAVGAVLGLLGLLLIRRRWVARLLQLVLVLGAVEWALTAQRIAMVRMAHDQPFLRMAVILGAVAAVTLIAALIFQTRPMKRIYCKGGQSNASAEGG